MRKFTLTNNFIGSCPVPRPEFCGFFRIDFMTLILRRLSPGISELRLTGKIFGLNYDWSKEERMYKKPKKAYMVSIDF